MGGRAKSDSARADFPVDSAMGKESANSNKAAVEVTWSRSHVRQRAELRSPSGLGQATEHHIALTSGMAVINTRCTYCAQGFRSPCVRIASLIVIASLRELALPTVGMVAVTFTSLLSFYPVLVSVIISLGLSSSLTTGYLLSILAYCLEDRASSRNLKYIRYICCVQDNRYTNVILDHCGPRHAKVNSSKNAPRIVKRQA
jgi:hypothetical protein